MTLRVVCALAVGSLAAVLSPVTAEAQRPANPPAHEHPAPATEDEGGPETHTHGAVEPSQFRTREASGTAWLPDVTPMYGLHRTSGAWELMVHGNGFVQFLHESAPEHRGASQMGSINWGMAMARRPVGAGWVGLRSMVSLEPLTIRGCGYPDLLATGELCDGDNIHDRQHPHDLFMEMAAQFDRPLTRSVRWQVYGALAGEPALGPPAFPHRVSAMPNPIAPITHHWLDATHISFGVVTTGVYGARWKAETSVFNGREPDEARYGIDLGRLDSVSGRVSFLPTAALALQVSAGRLESAELESPSAPAVDVVRVTSSATYHRAFGGRHMWATTVAWGANREDGDTTHGVLLESAVSLSNRDVWFGRLEVNGKPAHDLHIHESTGVFTVGKAQSGYTRYMATRYGLQPGVGGFVSAALVPESLQPRYGGVGVGVGLFLTLRSSQHQMTP
jgi:hypothetical protein